MSGQDDMNDMFMLDEQDSNRHTENRQTDVTMSAVVRCGRRLTIIKLFGLNSDTAWRKKLK